MHLGYCMSYNMNTNETVWGACFYNNYKLYQYLTPDGTRNLSSILEATHAYYPLPWNKSELDTSCDFMNRKGVLCGKCKDGFAPPLLSFDLRCMNCSHVNNRVRNWVVLCMRVIGPITVLYVLALVFRLSALSPKLNGFIMFGQYVSSPPLIRQVLLLLDSEPSTKWFGRNAVYGLFSLYSWCNLDFFSLFLSPICDPYFSDMFSVFAFNYVSIFYPLLLVFLTYLFIKLHDSGNRLVYLLCQPCHRVFVSLRKCCNVRHSLIDVFASLILLSYVRFLSVSLDILTPATLRNIHNRRVGTFYWYYDASLELYGRDALPLVIPSFCIIFTVILLPSLLLCCCSVKHPNVLVKRICCKRSHYIAFHTFMDAFHGCYKDGTEPGTHNCRFVASINLFLRCCFYLLYAIVLNHHYHFLIASLALVYAVFLAIIRPYKKEYALQNVIDPLFLMLYCLMEIVIMEEIFLQSEHRSWLSATYTCILIVAAFPLIYLLAVILHGFANTRVALKLRKKMAALCTKNCPAADNVDDNENFNVWITRKGYGTTESMTQKA